MGVAGVDQMTTVLMGVVRRKIFNLRDSHLRYAQILAVTLLAAINQTIVATTRPVDVRHRVPYHLLH